jgi:hypothetical protein
MGSWFGSLFPSPKPEQSSVTVETETELFRGDWSAAGKQDAALPNAVEELFNYAIKIQMKHGKKPFDQVGASITLRMEGVVLGRSNTDKDDFHAGDFEIEVRRVG